MRTGTQQRMWVALAAAGLWACTAAYAADWDDERAVRAFETLDANDSGRVSLREFEAGVGGEQADRAESYFRRIDANRDGAISAGELRAEWDNANNVLRKDVYDRDSVGQAAVHEAAFRELDADRDGTLSRREFQAGVKASAGPDRANHEFERIDDNGDERLSRGEFEEDWDRFRRSLRGDVLDPLSAREALPLTRRQELTFDRLDTDGDGRLEMHEYRMGMRGGGAERAEASFRALDDDENGALSRAELYEEWDDVAPLLMPGAPEPALGVERREVIRERRVPGDWTDEVLQAWDANDDGRLTLREYSAGVSGSRSDAERAFERLDRNNDGMLTRAELAASQDRVNVEHEIEIDVDD